MSLVNWARDELERLSKDDNDGMQETINKDILDIVELFSRQGHSGFSASYALRIINRLLDWKPITPLTGEEEEWSDVSEWDSGTKTQQNKRCPAVFRDNYDNSTARYIYGRVFSDNGGETWFTKGGSSVPVTFPFTVPDKPEYIILDDAEAPKNADGN